MKVFGWFSKKKDDPAAAPGAPNVPHPDAPADDADIRTALLGRARAIMLEHTYDVGSWPTPQLDSEETLRNISRSTEIVGRMLDGMSSDAAYLKKPARFLTRTARVLWGIVEAATPHSIGRGLMKYWFYLLLLFEIILIAAGVFASGSAKTDFVSLGVKLLALTLGARLVIELTNLYIGSDPWWRRLVGYVVVVIAIAAGALLYLGTHYAKCLASGDTSCAAPPAVAALGRLKSGAGAWLLGTLQQYTTGTVPKIGVGAILLGLLWWKWPRLANRIKNEGAIARSRFLQTRVWFRERREKVSGWLKRKWGKRGGAAVGN